MKNEKENRRDDKASPQKGTTPRNEHKTGTYDGKEAEARKDRDKNTGTASNTRAKHSETLKTEPGKSGKNP